MLPWSEVAKTHQTWKGVYTRGGLTVSLLCNPHEHGTHGDDVWDDALTYRVSHERHKADANSLKRTMEFRKLVRVFEKIGRNQWVDRALWTVESFEEDADGTRFFLRKAPGPPTSILSDGI